MLLGLRTDSVSFPETLVKGENGSNSNNNNNKKHKKHNKRHWNSKSPQPQQRGGFCKDEAYLGSGLKGVLIERIDVRCW